MLFDKVIKIISLPLKPKADHTRADEQGRTIFVEMTDSEFAEKMKDKIRLSVFVI